MIVLLLVDGGTIAREKEKKAKPRRTSPLIVSAVVN